MGIKKGGWLQNETRDKQRKKKGKRNFIIREMTVKEEGGRVTLNGEKKVEKVRENQNDECASSQKDKRDEETRAAVHKSGRNGQRGDIVWTTIGVSITWKVNGAVAGGFGSAESSR